MGKQWEGCTGGRTAKACPLDPETHWEVTAYLEGSAQKSLREGHAWGGGGAVLVPLSKPTAAGHSDSSGTVPLSPVKHQKRHSHPVTSMLTDFTYAPPSRALSFLHSSCPVQPCLCYCQHRFISVPTQMLKTSQSQEPCG